MIDVVIDSPGWYLDSARGTDVAPALLPLQSRAERRCTARPLIRAIRNVRTRRLRGRRSVLTGVR